MDGNKRRRRLSRITETESCKAKGLPCLPRRRHHEKTLPRILQQHNMASIPLLSHIRQVQRRRLGTVREGERGLSRFHPKGIPAQRYSLDPRLSSHASPQTVERETARHPNRALPQNALS